MKKGQPVHLHWDRWGVSCPVKKPTNTSYKVEDVTCEDCLHHAHNFHDNKACDHSLWMNQIEDRMRYLWGKNGKS